jgi:hypothetical protein
MREALSEKEDTPPAQEKKNVPFSFCALFLMLFCVGCVPEMKWKYRPDPPMERPPLLANSVTVPSLSDERPSQVSEKGTTLLLLMFLPGVLYQTIIAERAEEIPSSQLQYHPADDIAHAVADEVENRRIFKSVAYSKDGVTSELSLRGRLTSTRSTATLYQYGISVFASYLWLLGLPAMKAHFTLEVELQLDEPISGILLWKKTYKKEREYIDGMYYGMKRGEIQYDAMLKELMPEMLSDLEAAIKGMTTAAVETAGQR